MKEDTNMLQRIGRTKLVAISAIVIILVGVLAYIVGRTLLGRNGGDGNNVTIPQISNIESGNTVESAFLSTSGGSGGNARLQFRLSKGQAQPDVSAGAPLVTGIPLTAEEIQRVLDRLPELVTTPGDTVEFNLPDASLPPPLTGETITEAFPPAPDAIPPESVPSGPLEVLRFGPEGEIPIAPFLNVTFNQPMVPLATIEELTAEQVPVKLTPSLPGVWRWLGTKTLTFEHSSDLIDRFPMATEYTVEVPAGTESAVGTTLAETVTWSFSTPPPQIESFYPQGGPQPLEPVIFIGFDQRIDPTAVLAIIQMNADGRQQSLRLATDTEIEKDDNVRRLSSNAQEGRWLAFRAEQSLPADSDISITIGPGTPSAEGPLVTRSSQTYSFRTYAPLTIERHRCGWDENECPPFAPFFITFNNPLDVEVFEEIMLEIEPELPGASASIVGNTITIEGATSGRTTYRVTVSGSVQDIFGQTLGQDETLTFRVGSAPSSLSGPSEQLVTVDPSAEKPLFTVYSINYDRLQVRAYAVEPSDWNAYKTYQQNYYREDNPPTPPGQKVLDETISLDAVDDALTETAVDLSEALDGDYGHLIVIVEPPSSILSLDRDRRYQTIQAWVQVTQIGLDAFVDHSEMVVWATKLQDGSPIGDLPITLAPGTNTVTTGADGTVKFDLAGNSVGMLVAQQGEDTAILLNSPYIWGDGFWRSQSLQDEIRWYVFDDRQMYRPGEDVHIKGWIRRIGARQNGDVGLLEGQGITVNYRVIGPQGNEFQAGSTDVNTLGGFDLAFTLPDNANLGYAGLSLSLSGNINGLSGRDFYHGFQIQEFRRPEFEVVARNETSGPYFVGDHAVVAVSANYYAGGPLPNADVTWQVTSSPSSYSPPNWPDFTFGKWTPWWWYGPIYEEAFFGGFPQVEDQQVETFEGITDASGNDYLRIDFDEADEPRPFSLVAEATVMDVNRQAWAGATSLLVHPSDLYIGIRSDRTFVERGTPLDIEAIVTDLDGTPLPGNPILIRAARLDWRYSKGSWREEEVDVQECTLQSTAEPITCTFETPQGGSYQITAVVTDNQGRQNQSQFTRWVSGGQRPPARKVEQETVTLIPDKEIYQPGDVAEILVQSPFSPAEGLLTVLRSGILYTERFMISEGTHTLRVPMEEGYLPNIDIQVDLVGNAPRTDNQGEVISDIPPRPAYATGTLNLNISTLSRTLSLQVSPQQTGLEPGGETAIDVLVTDANGRPVADAELAVVVVDEAILALTNYQLTDPISTFYSQRWSYLNSYYGRASIILANPESLANQAETRGAALLAADTVVEEAEAEFALPAAEPVPTATAGAVSNDDGAAQPEPIKVRTNFDPLATFAPAVHTNANGQAQVSVQLPDNLTRYRIMVVAVAGGKQFGTGESNLTARLPLMVRPSAPRFLNFGDRFELPIVLQNQTDESMSVDVVVQAGNIILTAGMGQRVTVPANDRVEVRFPATTDSPGTARLQIAAVSGSYADAADAELPVYTPATTEAFATYGVVDEGAIIQPVASPVGVFPQFGGLEINTSSTALQALTDAVIYLANYPYQCSEQAASRILAIAALRDVLTAFEAEGLPSPAELEQTVRNDIERLQGLQNNDGGFPIWIRGKESIPYYTIHVTHALQRARLKGFDVPGGMMQPAMEYLRNIESHYPSWYSKSARQTMSAYALYVRQVGGDVDAAKARNLFQETGLENLSLEALAWLWQVLNNDPASTSIVESISRHINNRAVETAGAANFTTSYGDEAYLMLHSNRRTDGIILDALIAGEPQSDLIPKVVNGLLAHRTRGRWDNTQENAFILLALDRYFNTFEAETPDFVARIWLGDTYAGDHTFVGRTTERHETDIPMTYLVDSQFGGGQTQDLILSKDGPGRLYYRLGLRYAPTDLDLDPLDMGFIVQRVYEAVDDPDDVQLDENGVWHIKAGARVRVRLSMVADNRRYHVALVDPLPAGLEIINPALAVSGDIPQDPNTMETLYGWWWWGTWYEHQNMRDERAEAFTTLLWDGVYEYTYIARATTPGEFVVPPAKAEEMYSPEVFGRSGSDRVIVTSPQQ